MKKLLIGLMVSLCLCAFVAGPVHAACTQAISTEFKGNLFGGLYLKADTYKIAFYQAAAVWDATTKQYAATNEITGTNYTAGGYELDTLAYGTSATTYWMDFADEVQATVTFNQASTCAIIYDDTTANTSCTGAGAPWACCSGAGAGTCADSVIGVFTFTSVQPSAGTLTVTFPTADASNAIVRIARNLWEYLMPAAYAIDRVDATVEIKGLSLEAAGGK